MWFVKYVNVYIGVKLFKCMISGCFMIFFLREGFVRYVFLYFNDVKFIKRQKLDNDFLFKKVMKKKKKKMKNFWQVKLLF